MTPTNSGEVQVMEGFSLKTASVFAHPYARFTGMGFFAAAKNG